MRFPRLRPTGRGSGSGFAPGLRRDESGRVKTIRVVCWTIEDGNGDGNGGAHPLATVSQCWSDR